MSKQVALITGGATGIGKAVALKLAAQGVNVIMSGRRAEVGETAVQPSSKLDDIFPGRGPEPTRCRH